MWDIDNITCHGKYVREICIFGPGDLPFMATRPHLFVNKFMANYRPITYDCLEELHYNRTRQDIMEGRTLDLTPYEKAAFVRHHVRNNTFVRHHVRNSTFVRHHVRNSKHLRENGSLFNT